MANILVYNIIKQKLLIIITLISFFFRIFKSFDPSAVDFKITRVTRHCTAHRLLLNQPKSFHLEGGKVLIDLTEDDERQDVRKPEIVDLTNDSDVDSERERLSTKSSTISTKSPTKSDLDSDDNETSTNSECYTSDQSTKSRVCSTKYTTHSTATISDSDCCYTTNSSAKSRSSSTKRFTSSTTENSDRDSDATSSTTTTSDTEIQPSTNKNDQLIPPNNGYTTRCYGNHPMYYISSGGERGSSGYGGISTEWQDSEDQRNPIHQKYHRVDADKYNPQSLRLVFIPLIIAEYSSKIQL